MGIAQWLERRARDQKIQGSNPGSNGGRIFLSRLKMLMHAIAHGGCTDTVRESALETDSRRKVPCRTEDSNRAISVLRLGFSVGLFTN